MTALNKDGYSYDFLYGATDGSSPLLVLQVLSSAWAGVYTQMDPSLAFLCLLSVLH
jgi:hypothetical protein